MRLLLPLASALLSLAPHTAHAGWSVSALGRNVLGGPGIGLTWAGICAYTPYCGWALPGPVIVSLIVIDTVMLFIGSSAIVAVVYGAIRIITSMGEQDKITAGRKAILYGLLGLFLAIVSDALFRWLTLFIYAAAS